MPGPEILLWLLLGLLGAVIAHRILAGRRERGWWLHCEYWIYGTAEKLPVQSALLARITKLNPYNRSGAAVITQREGLLLSDVRLHLALALKSKNPGAFRPDLFPGSEAPSQEALEALAEAASFSKVRYSSRRRLRHNGHLRLLPHAADALLHLTGGLAVFDVVAGRLMTAEAFRAALAAKPEADGPGFHLRVEWEETRTGGRAFTRGLRKVGLAEWTTLEQEADQKTITLGLIRRAADRAFRSGQADEPIRLQELGGAFQVVPTPGFRGSERVVRLIRETGA